jgi:hypothetical protein
MHNDVVGNARWVLMLHVSIGCWCVMRACVENYIN